MKTIECPACNKPVSAWKIKRQFQCGYCDQVIVSNITIATILSLSLGGLIGVIFASAFCHNNSLCAFFIDTGIALLVFVFTYPYLIKLKIINDE